MVRLGSCVSCKILCCIPDLNTHLSLELSSFLCLASDLHYIFKRGSVLRRNRFLNLSRGYTKPTETRELIYGMIYAYTEIKLSLKPFHPAMTRQGHLLSLDSLGISPV